MLFAGTTVLAVGVLVGVILFLMSNSTFKIIFFGIITEIAITLGALFILIGGVTNVNRDFISEVPITQIPVVGSKYFESKVRITYTDGKLKKIELAKGTTVEVGGNTPAEIVPTKK